MPQQPQDPWAVVSVGNQPANQSASPAPANPNAPAAHAGTPNDPWAVVQIGNQPTTPAPQGGTPAAPTAQPPLDGNGQPIVHSAPTIQPTATISAHEPTWLERIENMFSDYRRTDSGIGKIIPSYHPLKEGEGMQILRPENIMTEHEKEQHPMATAVGEFGGGLTSPDNIALMLGTEGASTAYPLVEEALSKAGLKGLSAAGRAIAPRLLAGGFSLQMLKGAYDKVPEIRKAWDEGNESEVKRLFTHMVLDSSMALLTAKHAVKGTDVHAGSETQYEKAQRQLRDTERAVGGPPPAEPNPAPTPEEPGQPEVNTLRPTTRNIAGVDVPITAGQSQPEGPSFITRAAQKLATPGQAAKFQAEYTKPEGVNAVISALSQSAEDKIARHEALVNGDPVPEPISGTETPGQYSDPDKIWAAMQQAAEPTWQKAREASNREIAQWEQQKKDAIQSHQAGIEHHNAIAEAVNQNLSPGEDPMEKVQFNPDEVPGIPDKPVTFDELRDAVKQAKERAKGLNGVSFEDQTKARQVEVPKAEKALDKWISDHPDVVSQAEYDSAKKLHAESTSYQDMANYLRTKLAKGSVTGSDIRGLEAKINGNEIKERGQAGIGAFKRLVGPDVYQNLQDVAKLFDPIDKANPLKSWGGYVAEYAIGGLLGSIIHAGTAGVGLVGGIAAKAASEAFMNKLLFDPEFGRTFGRVVDAAKSGFATGRAIPNDLMGKLVGSMKDLADKITSSEEGAAGAAITRRKAGSPVPPKFGRAGLGSAPAPEAKPLTPISTETNPDYKMTTRDSGDIEMLHPNGDSQMVLHPEPDPRAGHEGQTQLRQTGISAVDHPGAGQEMMDEAVNRLNGAKKYSRIISDFPDRRSPDNEKHWARLAKRGHDVKTETSTDSFGDPWDSQFDLADARHDLNPGDGGRSYYIDMKPAESGFPEAKVEERKPTADAAGVTGRNPQSEISTRSITSGSEANGTFKREPNNADHSTGWDAIEQAEQMKPGYKQALLDKVLSYKDNGLKLTDAEKADPDKGLKAVMKHWASNLTWLYDNMPADHRDIAKQWYDSAHVMAKDIAAKNNTTPEKVAAVIAALSPQNPWDMNVGQAERIVQMYQEARQHPFTPEMDKAITDRKAKALKGKEPQIEFAQQLEDLRGKTWDQLKDRYEQALWMRMVDEAHGNPQTPVYAPDGKIRSYQRFNWGLADPMAKAIDIMEGDGSPQSIHDIIGDGHKIRNFYNNIISPNSEAGHATIDTHHINADMLKPMSSKNDVEVKDNFGGSPAHKGTGQKGTYSLHHEALKMAAKARGVLPREMQSITWEAIKTLMGDEKKTPELRQAATDIWRQYQTGALTLNEARAKIVKAAGGFDRPGWAKEREYDNSNTGSDETAQGANDTGKLPVLAVPRESAVPSGPGSGANAPEAVPATGGNTGAEDAFKAVRKTVKTAVKKSKRK